MEFQFRLRGKNLRHSWQKECLADDAMAHAKQVAKECAKDLVYKGADILVFDNTGNEVAVVPVGGPAEIGRT